MHEVPFPAEKLVSLRLQASRGISHFLDKSYDYSYYVILGKLKAKRMCKNGVDIVYGRNLR